MFDVNNYMNSQEEGSVRKIKNYKYQEKNLAGKGASGRVYKGTFSLIQE